MLARAAMSVICPTLVMLMWATGLILGRAPSPAITVSVSAHMSIDMHDFLKSLGNSRNF